MQTCTPSPATARPIRGALLRVIVLVALASVPLGCGAGDGGDPADRDGGPSTIPTAQPGLAWDERGIASFRPTENQRRFDVRHYRLALRVEPKAFRVDGSVRIRGRKQRGLGALELDLHASMPVRGAREGEAACATSRVNPGVLRVSLADASATTFDVEVAFGGHPVRVDSNSGWTCGLRFDRVRTYDVICTCFQPFFARFLFPCKDHPSDKAEDGCELEIEVPEALNVVATGRRVSVRTTGRGTRSHQWRTEYPIATNLISFSAAPYVEIEGEHRASDGTTVPLHHFVLPDRVERAKIAFAEVPRVLSIYEKRFGPFPFARDKFSLVETSYAGLENQTAIAYGSEFAAAAQKGEYDYILVHEAAHEWVGNAVTNADWRDVWLHEGLATFAEGLYVEARWGRAYYLALATMWQGKAHDDALTDRDVDSDDDIFRSAIVYNRAAAVIHMLRWTLGDSAFFKGLRAFVDAHRYGNVTTDDFRRAMERASGRDLAAFVRRWVDGTGLFDAVWDARRVRGGLEVGVRSTTGGEAPDTLPVLIRVTAGRRVLDRRIDVGPRTARFVVPITGDDWEVELDPEQWLLRGLCERRDGLLTE